MTGLGGLLAARGMPQWLLELHLELVGVLAQRGRDLVEGALDDPRRAPEIVRHPAGQRRHDRGPVGTDQEFFMLQQRRRGRHGRCAHAGRLGEGLP